MLILLRDNWGYHFANVSVRGTEVVLDDGSDITYHTVVPATKNNLKNVLTGLQPIEWKNVTCEKIRYSRRTLTGEQALKMLYDYDFTIGRNMRIYSRDRHSGGGENKLCFLTISIDGFIAPNV